MIFVKYQIWSKFDGVVVIGAHDGVGALVGRFVEPTPAAGSLCLKMSGGSKGHLVFPVLSLRAQRGNLVAVAMVICRRVFNLNEIATSLRSSQ